MVEVTVEVMVEVKVVMMVEVMVEVMVVMMVEVIVEVMAITLCIHYNITEIIVRLSYYHVLLKKRQ